MAENSKIEWTTHTFNPWLGCTKVSPACDGCYAEAMMDHRYGRAKWGVGETRQRTSVSNWRKPVSWNRAAEKADGDVYVFCASLADVFDNEVDPAWRSDLFALIAATPNLTWLLLTKRIGNAPRMIEEATGSRHLPANTALGATIANQEEYDRDRMKLWRAMEECQPRFTFGSFEPLLGPIILDKHAPEWIIAGGETDQGRHKAREGNTEWFRTLRDQSKRFGRAFFMKQMTNKAPIPNDLLIRETPTLRAA